MALALIVTSKNAVINKQDEQLRDKDAKITLLDAALSTAHANEATLRLGLSQCNAGVQQAADVANQVAAAGAAAVKQVQQAGAAALAKNNRIDAMPAATCADADAILLEGAN